MSLEPRAAFTSTTMELEFGTRPTPTSVLTLAAVILLALLDPAFHPCGAQTSEPSSLHARRIGEAVDIDGWLSEEARSRAQHVTNFTQRELNFGEPVSEGTEVAVLYDSEALYVGFWGFDREPGGILANEIARDFSWSGDDNFELFLDPFNDDRNGYLFVTNPNGALADALITENGGPPTGTGTECGRCGPR